MAVDYENLTDEEYYGCLKTMFNTDGWEIVMIELQNDANNLNNVQDCKDQDDLRLRQGKLEVLGRLLNLEDMLNRAVEEQETDEMAVFNSL